MVSHICLLVELGPICNSMAASLCLKSCEDHSLLKAIMEVYGETFTGLGPKAYSNMKVNNLHFTHSLYLWDGSKGHNIY